MNSSPGSKIYRPLLFLALALALPLTAWGQKKKMDLDDLMIKGELHSDGQMLMLNRQRNDLKNRIKFRTNYRKEMSEEIIDLKSTSPLFKSK